MDDKSILNDGITFTFYYLYTVAVNKKHEDNMDQNSKLRDNTKGLLGLIIQLLCEQQISVEGAG